LARFSLKIGDRAISEPEDFLKLAERMNSWALMVALISEGLGIHLGEESGLAQYDFVIRDAETMDGGAD
jgi:hypothetical protein